MDQNAVVVVTVDEQVAIIIDAVVANFIHLAMDHRSMTEQQPQQQQDQTNTHNSLILPPI